MESFLVRHFSRMRCVVVFVVESNFTVAKRGACCRVVLFKLLLLFRECIYTSTRFVCTHKVYSLFRYIFLCVVRGVKRTFGQISTFISKLTFSVVQCSAFVFCESFLWCLNPKYCVFSVNDLVVNSCKCSIFFIATASAPF